MIYVVTKRAGVWTVATDGFLLSFENYNAAIEVAQGAACVLRHRVAQRGQNPWRGHDAFLAGELGYASAISESSNSDRPRSPGNAHRAACGLPVWPTLRCQKTPGCGRQAT